MMRRSSFLARVAFACLASMLVWIAVPGAAQERFAERRGEIITAQARHPLTLEIAETEAQRAQGLMFRRSLARDRGMLFLYPEPQVITMWMKNTLIPLDMLFLDGQGRVVSIHERAVPESLRTISSQVRASAVLEVPGGTVQRLGIRIGDRVSAAPFGAP